MPQFPASGSKAKSFSVRNTDLYAAVADAGYVAYGVELTLPDDPLVTVRVIVPGFSALNRSINADRIRSMRESNGAWDEVFELLEPY